MTSQLTKYVLDTLKFAETIVRPENSQGKTINKQENATFQIGQQLDSQKVNASIVRCEKLIKLLQAAPNHVALLKLKQAHHAFIQLQACLQDQMKGKVPAHYFSTLVRDSIYWHNLSMESLFQAVYALKTWKNSYEHDLQLLYKKIRWTKEKNQAEEDLLIQWKELHNLTRYPYQLLKVYSKAHKLILKADLLAEHPDYNEGYKRSGKAPLGMIEISAKKLNTRSILERLQTLMDSGFSIIEERLFPELELNQIFS